LAWNNIFSPFMFVGARPHFQPPHFVFPPPDLDLVFLMPRRRFSFFCGYRLTFVRNHIPSFFPPNQFFHNTFVLFSSTSTQPVFFGFRIPILFFSFLPNFLTFFFLMRDRFSSFCGLLFFDSFLKRFFFFFCRGFCSPSGYFYFALSQGSNDPCAVAVALFLFFPSFMLPFFNRFTWLKPPWYSCFFFALITKLPPFATLVCPPLHPPLPFFDFPFSVWRPGA